MGLQDFERRLERLVEGAFAKVFRSGLHPVELVRRLTREMDASRTVGVRGGTVAPNAFRFALAPSDYARFESMADTLTRELATEARDHGRTEGYTFVGSVDVTLEPDDHVTPGTFLLASEIKENAGGGPVGVVVAPDGTRIPVGVDPVTIGRLPECEVVINDQNVSRRHAEVRREGGSFVVVDLGSTNGTKVNGGGVKERRLSDGDEIGVGGHTLRFETS